MATYRDTVGGAAPRADVRAPSSGWQLVWGVLLIVAGVLAIFMPGVAALATAIVLGWVLLVAGAIEIAFAIQMRARRGFGWLLASGILLLLLGVAILFVPLAAVVSLALLVAAVLIVSGIIRITAAMRLRPRPRWGWLLADGIVSVALAILIMVGWPQSSLVLIGVLTGFSLMASGIARIMLRSGDATFLAPTR